MVRRLLPVLVLLAACAPAGRPVVATSPLDSTTERPVAAVADLRSPPLAAPTRSDDPQITAGELLVHIKHLADPGFRGRAAGTDDSRRSATYVAEEFARYGLEPIGDLTVETRSFHQVFHLTISRGIGEGTVLSLGEMVVAPTDYGIFPTGHAADRAASGGVVFAGYGIHAPDLGYDDFADIDLTGKWALVLRYEPQANDPASVFDGKEPSRHAHLKVKVAQCARRGAIGMLLVTGPRDAGEQADRLPDGRGTPVAEEGLPFLQITRDLAARLLGDGEDLAQVQAAIDVDLRPRSRVLPPVALAATVHLRFDGDNRCSNVVGRLPGSDPALTAEAVIVGAHYDHVPPVGGQVRPGADDNASGTGGLLELAQHFASLPSGERPARTLCFVAFGAEEVGLIGSAYFVQVPPVPVTAMQLMVNLDMIGRPDYGNLVVGGTGTAVGLTELVTAVAKDLDYPLRTFPGGWAPTDSASFHARGVPVLYLMTGLHGDLHGPGDTWQRIDPALSERVTRFAADLIRAAADRRERLVAPERN